MTTPAALRPVLLGLVGALCLLALPLSSSALAQERAQERGTLAGTVRDADTRAPLPGANVVVDGTTRGTSTGVDGTYTLDGLPAGTHTVRVTFVGYQTASERVRVAAGETTTLDVALASRAFVGDEVVVTGSKRPEKLLDAPVQVEKIDAADLETSGGGTFLSALATTKGVDFVDTGINAQGISARGFNSQFNTRMLSMVDGRVAQLPGTGLPQGNFLPTSGLDVKSIEVVVGPASALYGPNAHTGVVNVITKDPWDQSGVALDVRGGGQSLFDVNGRVAGTVNDRFGWKATGQFMRASDFEPPTGGPDAPARDSTHYYGTQLHESAVVDDYDVESIRAEGSLYYKIADDWKLEAAYGFSQNDNFGLTNLGRNRILDWQVQYQNVQLSSDRVYAQFTRTANDAGDTFQLQSVTSAAAAQLAADPNATIDDVDLASLRDAFGFTDKGELLDSEVQYRETLFDALDVTTGVQFRRYKPDSEGTFLADAAGEDIDADEIGGYLQLDWRTLNDRLRVNAAARVDDHSNYDAQFSPKAALVYTVAPNHNVRVGYNRAFKSPTILENNLFIITPVAQVPGYYFNSLGNVDGYVIKDASGNVVRTIDPLAPEEVNSIEVGYKGVFGKRLFVDVVAYNSWYQDFISPLTTVADGIETVPFEADGTTPVTAPQDDAAANALQTYFNFGEATVRGLDVGVNVYASDYVSFSGNVSLIDLADFTRGETGDELLLNVPNTKLKGSVSVRDAGIDNYFISLSGRWQSAYAFRSGYWDSEAFYDDGEIPSRLVMNLTAGYDLPAYGVSLKASVSNLFNNERVDVLGAPERGRLVWIGASYTFGGLDL